MGYYSNKKIASVVEPDELTLANNPNFVVFSSLKGNQNERNCLASIEVVRVGHKESNLRIEITETQSGRKHIFRSTYDEAKINDNTFYIVYPSSHFVGTNEPFLGDGLLTLTAQNLKNCLLKNSFIRNNFDVTVNISKDAIGGISLKESLSESNVITLRSKGYGTQYNISIQTMYENIETVEPGYSISLNNLHYPDIDLSGVDLTLNGHFMRVAIFSYLYPSYDKNEDEYFQIILPQDNQESSITAARLKTLENLREAMMRTELASENLTVEVNKETMTIECYYSKYNQLYILDTIYSDNEYITVKNGNTEPFDKS